MQERFTPFTVRVSRLHKLIQKLKTAGMGRFGLKAVDTLCLYQLSLSQSLTPSEISEQCDLDPALVSRTLRALVKGGMVLKDGEPGKYKARYSLSPVGRQKTAEITDIIHRIQKKADQGISPEDLQIFYRVLGQLTANFEALTKSPFIENQKQEEHSL